MIYYLYVKTHNITGIKYLGRTGRKGGQKCKSLMWITNGVINKRIDKQEIVQFGFQKGRTTGWNTRP